MGKIKTVLIFSAIFFLVGCSTPNSVKKDSEVGSIWKSSDGGKTWEVKNQANEETQLPQMDILNFIFNTIDNDQQLISSSKGGYLIKTLDGGDNWTKINLQVSKIYGLDVDPNDGSIIYASGIVKERGKLFKSFDGGEEWKEIFTFPADGPLITNLIVDKKDSKIIYISTSDNQIIKSYDSGESWQQIFDTNQPIVKILIDSKNNNLVYAIDIKGKMFRSNAAGKNFEEIKVEIENKKINGFSVIEVDPFHENWIYVGGRSGLCLSKDSGESWQELPTTFNKSENNPIKAIAINPDNSKEIIFGSSLAVYKSIDSGENWSTSQFDGEQKIRIIEYNPKNTEEVYVGFSK